MAEGVHVVGGSVFVISKVFKRKSEKIAQGRPVLMFHEGDLGGRGGTGLKQNLVVREKGWVQFVVFGLESTSPRNGEREHDVSPNTERVVRDVQTLSKAGWEKK